MSEPRLSERWATVWTGSAQGPYPVGNPAAQPDLALAFPGQQAREQTFRMMLRPSFWGERARLRFCNAFGTRPVTFADVSVALQATGAVIQPASSGTVMFGAAAQVTVPPGESVWSDPVAVPFAAAAAGRRLAVSFHIRGESGAMTWHAKGLTTSYVTEPGTKMGGSDAQVLSFPFTTTSWFFLDAVDMAVPPGMRVIVALGDSITDGTGSTLNGDDRWPDILLQRLLAAGMRDVALVNAGIGGNRILGPEGYGVATPYPGGPPTLERLQRDVLSLSGVTHVIWLEGINDFSENGQASAAEAIAGLRRGVRQMRDTLPGIRVIGATVCSALGSSTAAHGGPEQDAKRRALNDFIRGSGLFDMVADFDAATADPATGGLRAAFVPDSTIGGPGDGLHPNRAGYLAMAGSIDLTWLLGEG